MAVAVFVANVVAGGVGVNVAYVQFVQFTAAGVAERLQNKIGILKQ